MNKYWFLVLVFMTSAQQVFSAIEPMGTDLENSLKVQSSEPNFLYILGALLFVVCLIYITGIIYSRLNIMGASVVKEQMKNYDIARAAIVSTTQLGQGKNLHVIEISGKRYLIGATPNSISLIKDLGKANLNQDDLISSSPEEVEPDEVDEDAIKLLFGENAEVFEEVDSADKFDVHKKYL